MVEDEGLWGKIFFFDKIENTERNILPIIVVVIM